MPGEGLLRTGRTGGRIAFLGAGGNVYTVAPDGSALVSITQDADPSGRRYGRPMWSADGARLAFWGFDGGKISLYMAAGNGEWVRPVFESSTEFAGSLSWSRSGELLGFTTGLPGSDRLIFYVASPVTGEVTPIDAGVSSYSWDWGISDDRVAVQAGTETPDEFRQSVLQVRGNVLEQDVPVGGKSQAVLAWAPDGRSLAVAVWDSSKGLRSDRSVLVQIPVRINRAVDDLLLFGPPTTLASVSGELSFAWSPSGQQIAVAHGGGRPLSRLELLDLAHPSRNQVISEQPILAFFWSPDGRRLAYFSPGAEGRLRAYVFNMGDGQSHLVAEIVSSPGLRDMVTHFAEGQPLASIWSPDSRSLILTAGQDAEQTAEIWVYPVDGKSPPAQIAWGDYAAWSPDSFYR